MVYILIQQEMADVVSPTVKIHGSMNQEVETASGPSIISNGPLAKMLLGTLLVK